MPKLDGVALAEHLQRVAPEMPVIMISIDDDGSVRRAAIQAGASEFMVKPVARNDFASTLKRLIDHTSETRPVEQPPEAVPLP